MTLPESFADELTYQFKPFGFGEPRRERVRVVKPFHFPSNQVFLLGNISEDLVAVQLIPLTIEQDDDETYIVSDDIFLVYGDGESREGAIRDYLESLLEFYNILRDSQENPFDKKQFMHLQRYIQQKSQWGSYALQTNRD